MGESALTERLGAPLRSTPSCCVKASSPIERRPFGGGSEGALASLCAGRPPMPTGRLGRSGVAGVPTKP
eukprot:3593187-Alexandrium_andersonii.AAC.1